MHFHVRVGTVLTKISFVNFDIVGKKQIECGLAWCVLLSTTIRVITVVKICCGLTWLHLVSPQHFDDAYQRRFNKLTSVFLCVCPVIDHEFRHNIVKVAVDRSAYIL